MYCTLNKRDSAVEVLVFYAVPDYLRTKLDLDLERHQQRLQKEAEKMEATGSVHQLVDDHNSMLSSVVDIVNTTREEWPEYSSKLGQYILFWSSSPASMLTHLV